MNWLKSLILEAIISWGGKLTLIIDSSIILMRIFLGPIIWDGNDWFDGITNAKRYFFKYHLISKIVHII